MTANVLTLPWPGPYGGVPPWDQVTPDLFTPAFEESLAEERAAVQAIATSPEPPDFENTIAALERAGRMKGRVLRMFAVMRLNPGGGLDSSFDGDGKVTTDIGSGADSARAVAVQPDGKIVVSGYANVGTGNYDWCAIRLTSSGALDTGFGTGGIAIAGGAFRLI